MNFELNEDQRMIQSVVDRYINERYAPGNRVQYRAEARGYSERNWSLLAECGLLALPFSAEDGGMEGGVVEIATTMESFGRGLVAEPLLSEVLVAGRLLATLGSEEQKQRWLPSIIAGEQHMAFAFAEHGSRWNLRRIEARCESGKLSGAKTMVSGYADAYIVSALAGDTARLFLVEASASGIRKRDYRLVDGSVASELWFDEVQAEPLAGGIDEVESVLDIARLAIAAEMVGIMGYLFDSTLGYLKQRKQFGVAIGSFQAIQHRMADRYASLEQARSQLYRAMLAEPQQQSAAIAAAKAYIGCAAMRMAEECVQLHGGMGISEELDIGAGLKRLMLLATLFGDAEYEVKRYSAAA